MGRHAHSIDSRVLRRFTSSRGGRVFTAGDFLDLGSRNTVNAALSRQARTGKIRKLTRGLYDCPKRDPRIGPLMPSVELVAKALRGRDAVRLQPSGAYAANRLGLSEQVPMNVLFLTDAAPRRDVPAGWQSTQTAARTSLLRSLVIDPEGHWRAGHRRWGLFERVAAHRQVFFRWSWMDYTTLIRGRIRLVPPDDQMSEWRRDYRTMQAEMIFRQPDHVRQP